MRATEAKEIPRCLPSNRADQCVTPKDSGGASNVATTTARSSNTIRRGETPCTELHPDQFGPLADIKDFELKT